MTALGPLCAFMSSVTWALGSAGYARLSRSNTPFAVNFARAIVSLPLFVITVFLLSGWAGGWSRFSALQLRHFGWFSLSMFASYGLGDSLFLWSTRRIGVPSALAIASAYPIWTAGAGVLFRGEMLSLARWLGLLGVVSGVIIVILSGRASAKELDAASGLEDAAIRKRAMTAGFALAFFTSFFWALNGFAVSQGGQGLDPAVGNSVRMVVALVLTSSLGLLMARGKPLLLPRSQYMRYLWLFVLEGFCGSLFYLYGLSRTPLAIGSTLASLAPVLSVPVSVLAGLEKFSFFKSLGVVLVVLGVALLFS